tara:strand:- start:186 stop:740 length:555 start_codon:yes stop_codon:yes gene_type:complete
MSEEQLQEPLLEPIVESKEEPEEKPKKAKRQMTPEHKERLLQGLIKARARKAENIARKEAKLKSVEKEDEKVVEEIKAKVSQVKQSKEVDPRDLEIKELKKKLDGLTLQDVVKPKRKTKPKTIPEESEDEKPKEKKPRKPRAKKEKVEIEAVVFEPLATSIAKHVQQAPSIIFKSLRGSRMKKY